MTDPLTTAEGSMNLFISYWRCNTTRTIRIMEHRENSTPSSIAEMRLIGETLSDEDVQAAEALLVQINGSAPAPRVPESVTEGEIPSAAIA